MKFGDVGRVYQFAPHRRQPGGGELSTSRPETMPT
jgi:hypothetical protein